MQFLIVFVIIADVPDLSGTSLYFQNMVKGVELLEIIGTRQSDRTYINKPVERSIIETILEAARLAPSACNAQPWYFVVADDPELKTKLAKAASAKLIGMNTFLDQAPVIIAMVREKANFESRIGGTIKDKDYSLIDNGIAAGYLCLQAAAEGVGTCMIGWFNEKEVKRVLGIPSGKRVELLISLGYTEGAIRTKRRKDPEKIFSYNKYVG